MSLAHNDRPVLNRIRKVSGVLGRERFLPEELLALIEWIAKYYRAPIDEAVRMYIWTMRLRQKICIGDEYPLASTV